MIILSAHDNTFQVDITLLYATTVMLQCRI